MQGGAHTAIRRAARRAPDEASIVLPALVSVTPRVTATLADYARSTRLA